MANKPSHLEWCIVRLGEDHNWWVEEISDPVHWDVDHLSIVDPRQVDYIVEAVEPLRDYGFDPDLLEQAFIPFRIERDLGGGRIRLLRVKDSIAESPEQLFGLPDVVDEENGPYADFVEHVTRLRVKMLNDTKDFAEKLTVDEVEEELREEQNNLFMEGRSVHLFQELTAILDYTPFGWEEEEEEDEVVGTPGDVDEAAGVADDFDLDEDVAETEELERDGKLRWDEEEEGEAKEEAAPGSPASEVTEDLDALDDDDDDDDEDEDDDEDDEDDEDEDEDEDEEEDEDGEKAGQGKARARDRQPAPAKAPPPAKAPARRDRPGTATKAAPPKPAARPVAKAGPRPAEKSVPKPAAKSTSTPAAKPAPKGAAAPAPAKRKR